MPQQKVERIQSKRFSALGLLRKNALLQNYDCTFGQYFGLYDGERVLTSWRIIAFSAAGSPARESQHIEEVRVPCTIYGKICSLKDCRSWKKSWGQYLCTYSWSLDCGFPGSTS